MPGSRAMTSRHNATHQYGLSHRGVRSAEPNFELERNLVEPPAIDGQPAGFGIADGVIGPIPVA